MKSQSSILPYFSGKIYTWFFAPIYDGLTTLTGWRRKLNQYALAGLTPGKILDVGCGTGYLLQQLRSKGFKVYGIDPSKGMLVQAKNKYGFTDEQLIETTACKLPFPDAHFDIVVASGSLVHTPNLAEAAAEISRVLKPAGKLRIIDHATPVDRNFFTPLVTLFSHLSGDILHDYPAYFAPYCELVSRHTLGRGGYMQCFDFVKR